MMMIVVKELSILCVRVRVQDCSMCIELQIYIVVVVDCGNDDCGDGRYGEKDDTNGVI